MDVPEREESRAGAREGARQNAHARYEWEILLPAHRYVFAVDNGKLLEFNRPGDLSFHRFHRYQALKPDMPVHGMIAWPNTVLLRGPVVALVDPGLRMQGPPLLLALQAAGLGPDDLDLIINTHAHDDHVQGNAYFPGVPVAVHELEFGSAGPGRGLGSGADFRPEGGEVQLLRGEAGELASGLSFIRTPGHTAGSICVLAGTADGLLLLGGDTVGPLPSYFLENRLPEGFPGADQLLASWQRIRMLSPAVIVPGHNPPLRLGRRSAAPDGSPRDVLAGPDASAGGPHPPAPG
ncbi:MAG: hypothetical protein Kow00129_10170 [Thermoleophilia bacterium]